MNKRKRIAINIETDIWNTIISQYKKNGWKVIKEYCNFDKGIDHDYLKMSKKGLSIEFGWTNWLEGEIKCEKPVMDMIKEDFCIDFDFGEGVIL